MVCEGERTEPNYFEAFRVSSAIVRGTGYSTLSLVREALRLRRELGLEKADQVWAVFDHDDFDHNLVRQAFALAREHGVRVAYSNQAFELWYVLHFAYLDSALHRHQLADKLTQWLGRKYEKNARDLYEALVARQPDALRNAQRLLDSWESFDPVASDPVTTVHHLVEELNRWRR